MLLSTSTSGISLAGNGLEFLKREGNVVIESLDGALRLRIGVMGGQWHGVAV